MEVHEDAFLVHGAAADIWLVKLLPTGIESPDQYICKVLRVGPECFQTLHRNYLQDVGQNKAVDEIQRDFIRDFHLKAIQWSSIQHENIVRVFQPRDEQSTILEVEFCVNGTARQYLSSHEQVSEIKKKMISDVLKGVEYLHTMTPPIVHGCLNMDKLFVSEDGTTKVGEFGLAAFTRSFTQLAPLISYARLSCWMSPELVNFNPEDSAPKPTTASDIWALGCTLYEIISDQLPYSKYKHELRVRREITCGILPAYLPPNDEDKFSISLVLELCWTPLPDLRPSASTIRLQYDLSSQAPPPASLSGYLSTILSKDTAKSTEFTRRPIRQIAWPRISLTSGILTHVNNWHKNEFGRDMGFQCQTFGDDTWEAVPKSR
ncbi:kinase-like protein [Ceratobasidium sp. AG-I]|nr:kinase-like protein [Ceratobasidium sp. AG-I]